MKQQAVRKAETDLICISHLRWDFVYQRPQHLMSRIAKDRSVIFFEEPRYCDTRISALEISTPVSGVTRVVPLLKENIPQHEADVEQAALLGRFIRENGVSRYDLWYYTPMGLRFTRNLHPEIVIFDCMDELSGFLGAPVELRELEQQLLDIADVVFTGGASLYEAKRTQHSNVHCCPSSIDAAHFARAQCDLPEPEDQRSIPRNRVGFYGVIDERFDTELLSRLAALRRDLQFVIIGPIVKIDESVLPKAANIHYLGKRAYEDLPFYLTGWDVAMLPFARNDATRFISPTKTPEYLAAGKPVVSTSIRDVVRPYGELNLVSIADTPEAFANAIDYEMRRRYLVQWRKEVDQLLSRTSWDSTWAYMSSAIETARGNESELLPAAGAVRVTDPLTHVPSASS